MVPGVDNDKVKKNFVWFSGVKITTVCEEWCSFENYTVIPGKKKDRQIVRSDRYRTSRWSKGNPPKVTESAIVSIIV